MKLKRDFFKSKFKIKKKEKVFGEKVKRFSLPPTPRVTDPDIQYL